MTSLETAQYDVVTILKKCKEHIKSAKQGIIDVCHIYEAEGKIPKEKIGELVYEECRKLGYSEDDIHYVRQCVPSEFKDHSNDPKSEPTVNGTLENLNQGNINIPLTDKRFEELKQSPNDTVPVMAQYKLSEEQVQQLTPAEQKEFVEARNKVVSSVIAQGKDAKENIEEIANKVGVKTTQQELKESTVTPPEALWSKDSLSYKIHDGMANYHTAMAKAHYDIRDNIEKFTPTKEIQEEHLQHFIKFRDKVIVPLANIDSFLLNFQKIVTDNVTDEKYGDTFLNWLKIAEDKFWSAGNHGSGEINSILTGKYIGKLKTNQNEIDEAIELGNKPPEFRYVVVETPIEREYTREQVGDETKFAFNETKSLRCSKEGCGHENFYKVVPVEISDSVFGDWFNKAKIATVGNELENQLETICDHVALRQLRSPVDILKYYNPKATDEDIKKLKYIFGDPENMKAVDIDSKSLMKLGYNIIYGRAGRRANKAQHFSDNS